ncbi:MAG: heparan N-sulfatase, partial [Planctomycetales bacterium]|nr:heparan N-sulfatase [Planctomycetales bacterium]
EFELYDIGKDPFQVNNVAGSPEYAETLQQLKAELHQRLLATADARAQGNGDQFDQYPYYGGSPLHPDFKAD